MWRPFALLSRRTLLLRWLGLPFVRLCTLAPSTFSVLTNYSVTLCTLASRFDASFCAVVGDLLGVRGVCGLIRLCSSVLCLCAWAGWGFGAFRMLRRLPS